VRNLEAIGRLGFGSGGLKADFPFSIFHFPFLGGEPLRQIFHISFFISHFSFMPMSKRENHPPAIAGGTDKSAVGRGVRVLGA
jgi:hypothetical protein